MYLKDPIYLNGSYARRPRRISPLRQIANVLFIGLVIGANYYVFFSDNESPPTAPDNRAVETERAPVVPPPVQPAPATTPSHSSDAEDARVVRNFEGHLAPNDTVFQALLNEGLENHRVAPVLTAMQEVFDFRRAQVGHHYRGTIDSNGRVVAFEYQTGPLDIYEVDLSDGNYQAVKRNIPVDRQVVTIGCAIGSSLFASLTRCGEGPELARMLTDLFAFDVDFYQEIRQGDIIRIIVEKVYINGQFLRYDNIQAAQYEGKFGTYTALAYENQAGLRTYYSAEGQALQKEFLKTPLKYTRISSGYTERRMHPTLHRWRRHLAIDYAAPMNTPVQAVASGRVTHVGRHGAAGNRVVIEHSGSYTSYYAHLNRFGDVEVGDQVDQRTVIGYVGQTGRATGPHLHFALKHGRRWVNPQTVQYTRGNPIGASEKRRFDRAVSPLLELLENARVMGLDERQG